MQNNWLNSIEDQLSSYLYSLQNADDKWINNYLTTLKENRIPVSVRRSRGKDIDAACGQLANKY